MRYYKRAEVAEFKRSNKLMWLLIKLDFLFACLHWNVLKWKIFWMFFKRIEGGLSYWIARRL